MAFNPFNWFRKHQKKLIGIVTIFVMFIFIVQFGKGDFFERALMWVGGRSHKGEVVTTLNGSKVRQGELSQISRQRSAASTFLLRQASKHHSKTSDAILKKELKGDPDATSATLSPLRTIQTSTQMREFFYSQFRRPNPNFPIDPQRLVTQIDQTFVQQARALRELGGENSEYLKTKTSDRLETLDKLTTVIGYQYWMLARSLSPSPDDLVFGGHSKEDVDTLDFMMWRAQADKMGIKLTDADLIKEINREATAEVFDAKVDLERDKEIQDFIHSRDVAAVSARDFIEGLKDEFRVVIAQRVLLGWEPGVRAYRSMIDPRSPASVSPEEFLEYYRYNRTALKAELLPIHVDKYLARVDEELAQEKLDPPTDREISRRFDLYKDREPQPGSREPGFKEPRKVVVQYLLADANNPQHRERAKGLAAYFTDRNRAERTFATLAAAPSQLGVGPLGPIAAVTTAAALDPLGPEYDRYVNEQGHYLFPIKVGSGRDDEDPHGFRDRGRTQEGQDRFREEALFAPRALISLMGSLPRGPLVALADHQLNVSWIAMRHFLRQDAGVTMRLGCRYNSSDLFGAAALALATSPDVRPRHEMTAGLLTQLEERLARELLREQFEAVTKALAALPKDKKEEAADKYLAQALKDYPALKLHTMPAPQGQLMLQEELSRKTNPKLSELLEPLRKQMPVASEAQFVATLFGAQNVYEAKRAAAASPMQRQFMPNFEPDYETNEALWWLKESHQAKAPKVVTEPGVRDKIVLAWKMDRARALAEKDAQALVDKINQERWTAEDAKRQLRERAGKDGAGEPFELDNVARLVAATHPLMGQSGEYSRYELPPDKRALMPYAPPNLADQLLMLQTPGKATLIEGGGYQTYYVAVLLARTEPPISAKGAKVGSKEDSFVEVYGRSGGDRPDPLFVFFVQERTAEYRRMVMKSLREEAGKVNKDGRFEIPEEFRRRDSSSREDLD